MIKKYKEFIKEEYSISLEDILPYYEIEDQFLRLKEVFGMEIHIDYCKDSDDKAQDSTNFEYGRPPCSYYYIDCKKQIYDEEHHYPTLICLKSPYQTDKIILSEINQIKERIESMYPVCVTVGMKYITIVKEKYGESFRNWDSPSNGKPTI
jgi:hypothetical protein